MAVHENEAFPGFLQTLFEQVALKDAANRTIVAVGEFTGKEGDTHNFGVEQHLLAITENYPARWHDGRGMYSKQPGALSFLPGNVAPRLQAQTPYRILVCLLDRSLLSGVERELDRHTSGDLHPKLNFEDPALRQLMRLLQAEVTAGGHYERLYREHLAHALALRLLAFKAAPATNTKFVSTLPYVAVRRVLERMNELEDDLGLEELAKESGYSRNHFSRMFRATTGRTPHNYLIHLRVGRAQEMIKKGPVSLIDVAIACGFSSHSHMTRIFRKILGVTPSEYQRSTRRR